MSGPAARARRASIRFHNFSWKWKTTVLQAGSTTASKPPIHHLPVSSQPTENATPRCREAKLRVLAIGLSINANDYHSKRMRCSVKTKRCKKSPGADGRGSGALPELTRRGVGAHRF